MTIIPAQPGWRVAWAEVLQDTHPISVDFWVMDVIAWRDDGEWLSPISANGATLSKHVVNVDYAIIQPNWEVVHPGPSHFDNLDDYKGYVFPHLVERVNTSIARKPEQRAKASA
jgi:hypothetical protein